MSASIEIIIISSLCALSCCLVGNFLILKKQAMSSDAITHTILLGIVLGYLATANLSSPLLIVLAVVIGFVTVFLQDQLTKTKLLCSDSAVGVVYPLLFSVAIILITLFASDVHLDTDSVLLGELVYAPFDRLVIFSLDIGATAIYTNALMLFVNLIFVLLFFSRLSHLSFDFSHAVVLGLSPTLLYYALVSLVSVTAVTAFSCAGSILVVAFMIVPGSCAYLLTSKIKAMFLLSCIISLVSCTLGFGFAMVFDVSIAGTIATVLGVIFLAVFLFVGDNGLVAKTIKRKHSELAFACTLVFDAVCNCKKIKLTTLYSTINISTKTLNRATKNLIKSGRIYKENDTLFLL